MALIDYIWADWQMSDIVYFLRSRTTSSMHSLIADIGDNIFLTLERQFLVTFYIRFSIGSVQPPITNISASENVQISWFGIHLWGVKCDKVFKLQQKKIVRILSLSKYNAHVYRCSFQTIQTAQS